MDENKNAFDASGEFLYFDVTLNGTSGVNSVVTGKRIWRGKVLTAGSSTSNEGTITVTHTTTTANVFNSIPPLSGQTRSTAFTVPAGYTGYLVSYSSEIEDNTSNDAEIAIYTKTDAGVTSIIRPFHISTDYANSKNVYGGLVFEEKKPI